MRARIERGSATRIERGSFKEAFSRRRAKGLWETHIPTGYDFPKGPAALLFMDEELLYKDITYQIRGACFWVWKEFGSAFKETVIDKALTEEIEKRGLKVENQKKINIYYNEKKVGTHIPDKIINDCVLVEVKRKSFLTRQDKEQFWHYLKGSEYKLGLLINFGDKKLEIKRIVYDSARRDQR